MKTAAAPACPNTHHVILTRPEYGESFKALEKAGDAIENAEYNLKGGKLTDRRGEGRQSPRIAEGNPKSLLTALPASHPTRRLSSRERAFGHPSGVDEPEPPC